MSDQPEKPLLREELLEHLREAGELISQLGADNARLTAELAQAEVKINDYAAAVNQTEEERDAAKGELAEAREEREARALLGGKA